MAAKNLDDLPPSYSNLAYEKEPVAGPSAPIDEDGNSGHGSQDPVVIPSANEDGRTSSRPYLHDEDAQRLPDLNPLSLVFEDIYDACVHYVDDNCCYGSRFINQMKLTNIHNTRALYYILESYAEMRETENSYKPYKGGSVDGPESGPTPHVWDISVRTPVELFKDDWSWKSLPHTETVETCYKCRGSGEEDCWKCSGRGEVDCYRCHGSGRDDEDRCSPCSGSGKERCTRCTRGKVTCGKCDGYKKLIKYKGVNIKWKNYREEFVTNTGELPKDLLIKTKPTVLFKEESKKIQPIITSDASVNAKSVWLLIKHDTNLQDQLIIRQRHILVGFPFTKVQYTWKDRNGEFFVYGQDREVYFDYYPQQCCWCC